MTGSKILIAASVISTIFLTACAAPGTYPISGDSVSASDPVHNMDAPSVIYRGESR